MPSTARVRLLSTALALLSLVAFAASATHPTAAFANCAVPRQLGVEFVIDDSGSMADSDPDNLRAQAVSVGLDQLPDGSLAAASKFSDDSTELFGSTVVTAQSRDSLKNAANNLDDDGGTDYEDAFLGAQHELTGMSAADRKAVIFLSDGAPDTTSFDSDQPIGASGTPIYTIGLGSADKSVLADIAARSAGQTFDATSAGELQAIFARIVAILTCDAQTVSDSFTLAPGASKVIPFAVGPDDGEFRALAAWSNGGITVTATRPDNSSMTPSSLLPGEGFVNQSSYALLTGTNPAAGQWSLVVTAANGNANDVSVTIDVWKRALVAANPLPPAGPAAPAPASPASTSCTRVKLIGVAGSGENDRKVQLGVPISALARGITNKNVGRTFDGLSKLVDQRYGRGAFQSVPLAYPALNVEWALVAGVLDFTGHQAAIDYRRSVEAGVASLLKMLNLDATADKDCLAKPSDKGGTRYVLAGYSQGAQVVGDVLASSKLNSYVRRRIISVVMFGDPKWNLDDADIEHLGSFSDESHATIFGNPYSGLMGARKVGSLQGAGNEYSVLSYCVTKDLVCQGLLHGDTNAPFNYAGPHLHYNSKDNAGQAAKLVYLAAKKRLK